jgi:hypothetical protein
MCISPFVYPHCGLLPHVAIVDNAAVTWVHVHRDMDSIQVWGAHTLPPRVAPDIACLWVNQRANWLVLFCFHLFVFVWDKFCYVFQAGLELTILLPQPTQCWDYRHEPPHPTKQTHSLRQSYFYEIMPYFKKLFLKKSNWVFNAMEIFKIFLKCFTEFQTVSLLY